MIVSKIRHKFANRLSELILSKQTDIYSMEKEIRISKSSLNRYLNARAEPTLTNLVILSNYFGVTLDELTGRRSNGERSDSREEK